MGTPAGRAFRSRGGEAAFMSAYQAALDLWPVPYEAMDIVGRYGTTHVVVCGPRDAPPLVLLHGLSATLTMWSENVADLSRAHRVYAVDVLGQPGTSVPHRPLARRADCVAWLSELLDALGIPRASLVGMSYGAWLALNYAIGAPERVNAIVLLSPAGGVAPMTWKLLLRGLLLFARPSAARAERFLRWFAYPDSLRDARTRLVLGHMAGILYLGARHFRLHRLARPRVFSNDELRGIRVPVLLLIGEQEVICDAGAVVARAGALIPGVEAELVAGSSHDMAIARAAIVDSRVLEFLGAH